MKISNKVLLVLGLLVGGIIYLGFVHEQAVKISENEQFQNKIQWTSNLGKRPARDLYLDLEDRLIVLTDNWHLYGISKEDGKIINELDLIAQEASFEMFSAENTCYLFQENRLYIWATTYKWAYAVDLINLELLWGNEEDVWVKEVRNSHSVVMADDQFLYLLSRPFEESENEKLTILEVNTGKLHERIDYDAKRQLAEAEIMDLEELKDINQLVGKEIRVAWKYIYLPKEKKAYWYEASYLLEEAGSTAWVDEYFVIPNGNGQLTNFYTKWTSVFFTTMDKESAIEIVRESNTDFDNSRRYNIAIQQSNLAGLGETRIKLYINEIPYALKKGGEDFLIFEIGILDPQSPVSDWKYIIDVKNGKFIRSIEKSGLQWGSNQYCYHQMLDAKTIWYFNFITKQEAEYEIPPANVVDAFAEATWIDTKAQKVYTVFYDSNKRQRAFYSMHLNE